MVWNEHREPQLKACDLNFGSKILWQKRVTLENSQVFGWSITIWSYTEFLFSKVAILYCSRALSLEIHVKSMGNVVA